MAPAAYNIDRRLLVAYVACGLTAVFYLPMLVPTAPSASLSYAFGYNNRAGVALLLLFVAVGAVWTHGLRLHFRTPAQSSPASLKTLAFTLAFLSCCCLAMYLLAGRFGGFGESSYEIDRVWLLGQGKTPYVDFEWPFGVGLLYGPLILSRTLHIAIASGYYLFWGLSFLTGTVFLWLAVNRISYPTQRKNEIFLLLFCPGVLSVLNMGSHYTFLRFSCPLYLVLVVYDSAQKSAGRLPLPAAALSAAFTACLLLVSPETAISVAFASICIFLFTGVNPRATRMVTSACVAAVLGGIFAVAAKRHVFATLKASGGGADSIPIGFAPHILLFFAALFLCGSYLVRRRAQPEIADNTFAVIAYSLMMTAAALGRCDVLHVSWNGEGVFLAALVFASNSRLQWRWLRATFIFFVILYPAVLAAIDYSGPFASVASEQLRDRGDGSRIRTSLIALADAAVMHLVPASRRSGIQAKLLKAERAAIPDRIDLGQTYPGWHGSFLAPAAYRPHGEGFGSYMSREVDYGYYQGLENANTLEAIHRKVAELQNNPQAALLLPDDFFESRCIVNFASMRHKIGMNLGFPYFGKGRHPENVRAPLCNFIQSQYVLTQPPAQDDFFYGLWVPKAAVTSN